MNTTESVKYDDCVFKTSCDVDKFVKHKFREEFRKKSEKFIQNLYELCQVNHSRKTSLLTIDNQDLSKLIENFKYELQVTYFL